MEMREVYSNRVASIGYEDGKLAVKWAKGGRTSVYTGVPEELAREVMNAPSVGSALRLSIEGSYPHSYL
jgi:KTSC domain